MKYNKFSGNIYIFEDDFHSIRSKYFSDIMKNKNWHAIPGGIQDMSIPEYNSLTPINISSNDEFKGYKYDDNVNFTYKNEIQNLLNLTENHNYNTDEFTICPSVSLGLLAAFAILKRYGINEVYFETPAYFGAVNQCRLLDIGIKFIPTLLSDNFCVKLEVLKSIINQNIDKKIAFMFSDPKFGLGIKQSQEILNFIYSLTSKNVYFLIDEAANIETDKQPHINNNENIIRLRGIVKGLGLNGIKVAAIFHDKKFRNDFIELLEGISGNIDTYSYKFIQSIASNAETYNLLKSEARKYIINKYTIFKQIIIRPEVILPPLDSGYIGCIGIQLPYKNNNVTPENYSEFKHRILTHAKEIKVPLVTGAALYFPYDLKYEWIRVCYFSSVDNIEKSALSLNKIITRLFD